MEAQSGAKANLDNIYIILVRPQMGENIGSIARAMLNFGISKLRIIEPRCGWPDEKAKMLSVGAYPVIEKAEIFSSIEEAISDIEILYASTARPRYMNKEVLSPEQAANEFEITRKIGILFGPENSGLSNEDIVLADKIITIPVNPDFTSINISHAAGVICYEVAKIYHSNQNSTVAEVEVMATKSEINSLFVHLEQELDSRKFFKVADKRQGMVNNIRNIFARIHNFTSQDVRTFRGMIKCLSDFNKVD